MRKEIPICVIKSGSGATLIVHENRGKDAADFPIVFEITNPYDSGTSISVSAADLHVLADVFNFYKDPSDGKR